jgi:TM2 domain-containing membrane protein YozV
MLVPVPSSYPSSARWAHSDEGRIQASQPPKDPLLMALLSGCLIAGLGQMVLGQVKKGITVLILTVLVAIMTAGIGALIMYPLMALDAYSITKKLKEGKSVGEWEWF